jgi:hypothetical protein
VRFAATALLWLVTTVALAVAIPTAWAQKNFVDVDGYAAMAQQAATDPALQAAVASELSTEAVALIRRRGYSVDPAWVRSVAGGYTGGPSFPPQFAQASRVAHRWMFTNDQSGSDPSVIDLAPMLNDNALQQMLGDFNVRVPASLAVPLTVSAPKPLRPGQLRPIALWNPWVSIGATVLAGICAVLTLAVAGSRAKALTGLGVSALLAGGSGWAAIEVARPHINDVLNHTTGDIRTIADAMLGHAEAGLHHLLDLTLAAGGLLVVLGVLVAIAGSLRR